VFIAVDGIDGAGKTTLVRLLARHLSDLKPLVTKEPTDKSEWGRALRDSALRSRMPREREIEFFHKDRINHLSTEIKPALAAKRLVICDRYVDSTLAFQARTPAEADRLYRRMVKDILIPDVTLILDCPVDVGLSRIQKARARFSAFENLPTLERAREIYASRSGPHYVHINASKSIDDTFRQACAKLKRRFQHLEAYLTECSSHEEDLSLKFATA
jgi:dTMP kinase